jgi:hypothetical protein
MEAVLNQSSSNDSPKSQPASAKYLLNANPSPRGQDGADGDSVTSPVTSPPYWVQSHQRSSSAISIESIPNGAITLQDNTDGEDAKNNACWAKSVYIEDHVIINGSRTGIGAFVVWNITVETLHVSVCFGTERNTSNSSRVVPCEFENDTPNSMICDTSFSKLSPTRKLRCLLYHRRASSRNSVRSFWRIAERNYNTFLS